MLKDTKQNQLTKKVPLQQICHKKRFTATTYKEIAETTFCRRSQQERKFARHDQEPQFANKMLSRPTRCRRNVVYFDREMFWKFEKEKIQKKSCLEGQSAK